MAESIVSHLTNLRKLYLEASPTDPKVISDYVWTIVKAMLQHGDEIDSVTSRQLLADGLRLTPERPSKLYSALLSAAIYVADAYPEFRFAIFLRMWDIANLRPEDKVDVRSRDGKTYHSLAGRAAKRYAHALMLHPEDLPAQTDDASPAQDFDSFLFSHNYILRAVIVTRINEVQGKDGRKYRFVTLTSSKGLQVETVSQNLKPSPVQPLPEGRRHYVNIGQCYNVLLHRKDIPADRAVEYDPKTEWSVVEAFLAKQDPTSLFPTAIGYIESIDQTHGHMHIYDAHSRHFVAPVQRFSRERAGDFVRFVPIIPKASKFKTAIILALVAPSSLEVASILRGIRITAINKDKGYAAWELIDKTLPITELLSPLQLSKGETSPVFTSGYLNLPDVNESSASAVPPSVSTGGLYSGLSVGQTLRALIYLKRGKDHQKRPRIARLYP